MKAELTIQKAAKAANSVQASHRGTPMGSLVVSAYELPLQEATRSGRVAYGGLQLAANGIAPDATLPTTAAKLALFNPASSGRTYYLDVLHPFLTTGTPAAGLTLSAALSKGPLATVVSAMATGFGVQAANGLGVSQALWGVTVTLPTGSIWHSIGGSLQPAAANFGQSDAPFEIRGGIAIPPGYACGFAFLSGAGTTPLYGISARWLEAEADLES